MKPATPPDKPEILLFGVSLSFLLGMTMRGLGELLGCDTGFGSALFWLTLLWVGLVVWKSEPLLQRCHARIQRRHDAQ